MFERCISMKTLLSIFVFFSFFCTSAQISQDTLSIYFDLDISSLDSSAIKQIREFNSSNHGEIVLIEAHCDTSGTTVYNMMLAFDRMTNVVNAIDSTAESNIAHGESISAEALEYDPALYRRVDIIYNSKKDLSKLPWDEQLKAFVSDSTIKHTFIDINILFFPGEAIMKKPSYADVEKLYKYMRNNPEITVHIHGHVCCGHNYVLSKNRAHAVYMYLLERRISYKRMKYTGHSNTVPKVWPEDSAEAKDANRRVSLEFSKP